MFRKIGPGLQRFNFDGLKHVMVVVRVNTNIHEAEHVDEKGWQHRRKRMQAGSLTKARAASVVPTRPIG